VRDLVEDWDVIDGVETCPEGPSNAASRASMSACQPRHPVDDLMYYDSFS